MLSIYLGIYIFILIVLWGFFFIARHHSYKFKHFSTNVRPVTVFLMIFLIVLSIAGLFLVFSLGENTKTIRIEDFGNFEESFSETYY